MIEPSSAGHPLFGRYVVVAKWARGGMADVYLARQMFEEGFSKPIALKLLREEQESNEELRAMFLAEARTSVLLTHPNIVQTFDSGEIDGQSYMAMELINGEPLNRIRRAHREPLPLPTVLSLVRDMALALDYANSLEDLGKKLDLVHRDVSPSNIMLTHNGNVKLIDFGVAKVAGKAEHTRAGTIKGKFGYMSPEQAQAQPIDGRSDIYALGVVLWELICNRRAFRGEDSAALLWAVANETLKPPSSVHSRCDAQLDAIVMRAVAQDRDLRYARAREFADALSAYLAAKAPGYDAAGAIRQLMSEHFGERAETLRKRLRTNAEGTPSQATYTGSWNLQPSITTGAMSPSLVGSSVSSVVTKSRASIVPQPRSRRGLVVAIAAAVTLFAALAVAAFFWTRADSSTRSLRAASDQEGTTVWIDGEKVGKAPIVIAVATGHAVDVIFRKDGFADKRTVIPAGSENTAVHATLTPMEKTGELTINTTPAGATVALDGRTREQKTPATFSGLWRGTTHRVMVTLAGHEPFIEDISLTEEAARTLDLVLEPTQFGFVTARCRPGPCDLFVDGKRVASTPVRKQKLSVGRPLVIELRKDGEMLRSRRWSFSAGERKRIEFLAEEATRPSSAIAGKAPDADTENQVVSQTPEDAGKTPIAPVDAAIVAAAANTSTATPVESLQLKPVAPPTRETSTTIARAPAAAPIAKKTTKKKKPVAARAVDPRKLRPYVTAMSPKISGRLAARHSKRTADALTSGLQRCYEKEYRDAPFTGKLTVSLTISSNGDLESMRLAGSAARKMSGAPSKPCDAFASRCRRDCTR